MTGTPRAFSEKKIWDKSLNTASLKEQLWENTMKTFTYDLGLNVNYATCPLQNPCSDKKLKALQSSFLHGKAA